MLYRMRDMRDVGFTVLRHRYDQAIDWHPESTHTFSLNNAVLQFKNRNQLAKNSLAAAAASAMAVVASPMIVVTAVMIMITCAGIAT